MRQSKNLLEAPIQKFTGFHNPEYKKKCTVYIGTVLSLHNLVGCRKKNVGVQEETAIFFILIYALIFYFLPFSIFYSKPKQTKKISNRLNK